MPDIDWKIMDETDKEELLTWFIGAMYSQDYCIEYIAECLVILLPALKPKHMIHPNHSKTLKEK